MNGIFGDDILILAVIGLLISICSIILLILNKRGRAVDLFVEKEEVKVSEPMIEKIEVKAEDLVKQIEDKLEDHVKQTEVKLEESVKKTDLDEEFSKTTDIDDLLKTMELDMVTKEGTDVETFEFEQEEKSIISFKELQRKAKANEKVQEPSIKMTKIEPEHNENKDIEPKLKIDAEPNKKTKSDFISPVFGRLENRGSYPTVKAVDGDSTSKKDERNLTFEETFNLEKLNEEIRNNSEFLNMLKDFRNNLE